MQIVIDKDTLTKMLKITIYTLTGADYKDVGDAVNELLEKVGYTELPKGHGELKDFNEVLEDIKTEIEQEMSNADTNDYLNGLNMALMIINEKHISGKGSE